MYFVDSDGNIIQSKFEQPQTQDGENSSCNCNCDQPIYVFHDEESINTIQVEDNVSTFYSTLVFTLEILFVLIIVVLFIWLLAKSVKKGKVEGLEYA